MTPITYQNLLTKEVKGSLAKRILIQGEGGVGKTTLCKKVAWDWCQGRILQDLEMVLVIPLRDVRGGKTISSIAKSYMSDTNSSTSSQIDNFVLENPTKVLLVFDEYDELNETVTKESSSDVIRILRLDRYKSCRVIVTTRSWRTSEFKMDRILAKAYTFVSVQGFNKENLSAYIKKNFQLKGREALEEDLISFMKNNDTIRTKMALFPVFSVILCLMWDRDEEKRKGMHKLQTFSQLFGEMISFLKERYASKMCKNFQRQDPCEFTKKADSAIQALGEIALRGLLANKLSFPAEHFSNCRDSMETCLSVGVLTNEKNVCGGESQCDVNTTSLVKSTVSFPHKLFQECVAGVYIHTLFVEDHARYERFINNILPRSEEFRCLLYFAAAAGKDVGISIIDGLIHRAGQIMDEERTDHDDYDFCIDVAFECHTEEAAAALKERLPSLILSCDTSKHTLSGIASMVQCNQPIFGNSYKDTVS
ncbi:NLR family CARD domain-containing protein 4-like [Diadema antillarum]|uniref:NLR family CARD domain-containing protein 4-like n=1 Tax=Diadema antillarum TaxID=105358 RepID=UPI003A863D8B